MNTKRLLAIVAISCSLSAYSATRTWIGNTSSAWNTASNWSGNSVPNSSDDVVISNGSASNQPVLDQDRTVANLSVSNGTLDLDDNQITVSGNASFTGGAVIASDGWIDAQNFTSMQNTTFTGLLVIRKTGGNSNTVNGGNTFNGPIAILNDDNSTFRMANSSPDDFNGIIHFEERSSGAMEPAYNGNNTFNGDISSAGSPNTVTFGSGNGTAIIDGTTTIYGSPRFNRLTVNSTGQINMQESQTISVVTVIAGTLDMDGHTLSATTVNFQGGVVQDGTIVTTDINAMSNTVFNGPFELEKTGGSDNTVAGGNTFNNDITIINSANNRRLRMANTTGDDFNGDVEFILDSNGELEPAYNGSNTFAGEISTDGSSNPVEFGLGNGIVVINGNTSQELVGNTSDIPTFRRFTMNSSGTFATNNIPLIITTSLSLTSGILVTNLTYPVIIEDNVSVTGAKNSSHVNGPVVKEGNDAFTFPVGDGTFYSALTITAPSSSSAVFRAQYFSSPNGSSTLGSGLDHISTEEHWVLDRTNSSSSVSVTLSWNYDRSGPVTSLTDLRVARWNGTQWVNEGNGATSGNTSIGTVRTSSAVTNFSPFTLGSSSTLNPLPISLINFDAAPINKLVKVSWATTHELNNDFFNIQKSIDGINWINIGTVKGAGNSERVVNYGFNDLNPLNGVQFYRLQQFDLNGEFEYSNIIPVRFNVNNVQTVAIYPNPNASNTLNVNLVANDDENASVRIINNLGQIVLEFNNLSGTNFSFDIKDLATGIYSVQTVANSEVSNTQLIKN